GVRGDHEHAEHDDGIRLEDVALAHIIFFAAPFSSEVIDTRMPLTWIALNSINGLGPVGFGRLLERYGTPDAVFDKSPERIVREGFLTPALAAQLASPQLMEDANRQLQQAKRMGVSILTLTDQRYPPYLREIFAPPPLIFVRGDLSVFSRHAVAVVGTRSPTMYGKQSTAMIARELAERGLVIVSGLARGIDTVAHESALGAGGATIAVLGSGVDTIYPRVNAVLAEKIAASGLIVSEFPMGTAPEAFNFPRRNRIISGCAAAVVVVEAGEKSGSLITARYALQQGREVCAVPGPIHSPVSRGTFNLIREGAIPVRSGYELAESLTAVTNPHLAAILPKNELSETVFSEEERLVLEGLSDQPMRIDAIAEQHRIPIAELFVMLLNLELKGLVQQCSGQQFVRI
ncbi:MAG: DNA-processing protein DprA, partial [Chitinispirillaceae bacterium]|nr:DNA-processing protein DprA [Chitinispirillaceae bacterium]